MSGLSSPPLLGAILVEQGQIGAEQLAEALEVQRRSAEAIRLGEVLLRLGYVDEQGLQAALEVQAHMSEEIGALLVPRAEFDTVLLVSRNGYTEGDLRPPLAALLHNLMRVDEEVIISRSRGEDVRAVMWEVDPVGDLAGLHSWRQACPEVPLIVLIPADCPARTIGTLFQGLADQVLVLPAGDQEVTYVLRQVLERQRLRERLRSQQADLGRMERALAFLEILGQVLTTMPAPSALFSGLLSGVSSLLEVEVCLVQFRGETAVLVGPQAVCLHDPPAPGLQRALDWACRHCRPLLLNDPRRHSFWGRWAFDLLGRPLRNLLVAPLVVNGAGVGGIAVANRLYGGAFSPQDRQVLAAVAGQAALALENLRLQGAATLPLGRDCVHEPATNGLERGNIQAA